MSRKGNCWDNAVAESFFKSLKCEMIYGNRILSADRIEMEIFQWIEIWYNKIRRHKALQNTTIDEFWNLNKKSASLFVRKKLGNPVVDKERKTCRRLRCSPEIPIFVMSYLTRETPQQVEIRTVAKSLPRLLEILSNYFLLCDLLIIEQII